MAGCASVSTPASPRRYRRRALASGPREPTPNRRTGRRRGAPARGAGSGSLCWRRRTQRRHFACERSDSTWERVDVGDGRDTSHVGQMIARGFRVMVLYNPGLAGRSPARCASEVRALARKVLPLGVSEIEFGNEVYYNGSTPQSYAAQYAAAHNALKGLRITLLRQRLRRLSAPQRHLVTRRERWRLDPRLHRGAPATEAGRSTPSPCIRTARWIDCLGRGQRVADSRTLPRSGGRRGRRRPVVCHRGRPEPWGGEHLAAGQSLGAGRRRAAVPH